MVTSSYAKRSEDQEAGMVFEPETVSKTARDNISSSGNFAWLFEEDDLFDIDSSHGVLLSDLLDMLSESEDAMAAYYDKWFAAEMALYNFFGREFDENGCEIRERKDGTLKHKFPLSWATLQTVIAYLLQVFVAREAVFDVATLQDTDLASAKRVQKKLQMEFMHSKGVEQFLRLFSTAFTYGIGVTEVSWEESAKVQTKLVDAREMMGGMAAAEAGLAAPVERERREEIVFEGNLLKTHDPFLVFPDPNQPFADASTEGDFFFVREFPSKIQYRRMNHVRKLWKEAKDTPENVVDSSPQHIRKRVRATETGRKRLQLDRGTAFIVPSDYWEEEALTDLGVVDADTPQLWFFVIANKKQIVYAAPFDADYQHHPFVVYEPLGDGMTTDPMGIYDLIGDLEDTASFLVNSRIQGTKVSLNQKILYNPAVVDLASFTKTNGGIYVPMKRSGLQNDPRTALFDFTPKNPTQDNFADLQLIIRIADMITGMNDNVRGIVYSGGRKSATEVRTAASQSSGRQSVNAMRASSQCFSDMAKMMVSNNLQYLSADYEMELFGEPEEDNEQISLRDFGKAFTFPIHDGTMPVDKLGMMQQWANVFQSLAADPELRQQYSLEKVLNHMAALGGIDDFGDFKRSTDQTSLPGQSMVPGTNNAPGNLGQGS